MVVVLQVVLEATPLEAVVEVVKNATSAAKSVTSLEIALKEEEAVMEEGATAKVATVVATDEVVEEEAEEARLATRVEAMGICPVSQEHTTYGNQEADVRTLRGLHARPVRRLSSTNFFVGPIIDISSQEVLQLWRGRTSI